MEAIDVEKKGLDDEEEGELIDDNIQLDQCSSTQFQMNMVLPNSKNSVMEEPDIEIDIRE